MSWINSALTSTAVLDSLNAGPQQWLLFFGSFHSLVVHFPIALVCLVLVLELYAWKSRDIGLNRSIRLILKLAFAASLLAPVLGWLLAVSDGYSGDLVASHMLAGILVPGFCGLALIFDRYGLKAVYRLTLTLAVAAVGVAGYLGGQIAHGKDHLTMHMPNTLRVLTGIEKALPEQVDSNSYFGARVVPILATHCVSCHGVEKSKGQLRLDNYEAIMKGGGSGVIVVGGNVVASEIYRRMVLDPDHKDFMPRDTASYPSATEISVIGRWIEHGAGFATPLTEIDDASLFVAPVYPVEVVMPVFDPHQTEEARKEVADVVTFLQTTYPSALFYESRSTANLELNASMAGAAFGDDDLTAFEPIVDHIVRADFSGTSVTDASSELLESMSSLRQLRIGHTAISDQTVARLTVLADLESLNIAGIDVSEQTLSALLQRPGVVVTGRSAKN